jgi:hypothetical protein
MLANASLYFPKGVPLDDAVGESLEWDSEEVVDWG